MKKCGVAVLLALSLCAHALGASAGAGEDWQKSFDWTTGTAVFLRADGAQCAVFNPDLAAARAAPRETFDIVLALLGADVGAPEAGAGELAEKWGPDRATSVDALAPKLAAPKEIDPDALAQALAALSYGNQEVREGALRLSAAEQAEALRRAFEGEAGFAPEALRAAMRQLDGEEAGEFTIRARAGGAYNAARQCESAWYVGLAERGETRIYFAVRLADPQNPEACAAKARSIACEILQTQGAQWLRA